MTLDNQKSAWELSYGRAENFVFYPHEEIIRFIAKYVRKKTGLDKYIDRMDVPVKILDVGCGIGTQICYYLEMGFDPYGFDLSENAINMTKERLEKLGHADMGDHVMQADITKLPWTTGFFNIVSACSVLDSMPYAIAKIGIAEVSRVMQPGGLFYCDLISGDEMGYCREYDGEVFVSTVHEKGTIQSYFNFTKIKDMIEGHFEIVEGYLIKKFGLLEKYESSRTHLVLRNIRQ